MKSLSRKVLYLQCALACAALASEHVLADDETPAPAKKEQVMSSIVVTAEKRSESINAVPMSITALSGDDLSDRGIEKPADLTKVVSGFRYSEGNNGTPVYSIRGIGFNETSLGALANVPIYVDEVPIPFPIMTRGAALDLQRVEVLKGPQGTLFGQNATGGAVNYIAAKPTDAFDASVTAGFGNFSDRTVEGHIGGPLSQTFGARFSFNVDESGPWQKSPTTGDELGRKDVADGRLLLDWKPTESLKVSFNVSGGRDRSDPQALQYSGYYYQFLPAVQFGILPASEQNVITQTPLSSDPRVADWGPRRPRNNSHQNQESVHVDFDLSQDTVLTYIFSHAKFNRSMYADPDGMAIENSEGESNGDISSTFHELRLSGNAFGGKAKWMAGLNYDDSTVDQVDLIRLGQNSNSYALTVAALAAGAPPEFALPLHFSTARNVSDQEFENKSAFAAFDWSFTDSIAGHVSARHTISTDDFSGCTTDPGDGIVAGAINGLFGSNIQPGGCITGVQVGTVMTPQPKFIAQKLDQSNNSWRASLDWKPRTDTLVYATLSRGYKGGSFPDLSAFSPYQYQPVVQESLLATEIGFKTLLPEQRLQFDGAYFHYDYQDKQVRGSSDTGFPFGVLPSLINVPRSTEDGVEFQAEWRPIEGWKFGVNAIYLRSRIDDDFISYDDFGALLNFRGESLPNTPKVQWNADAQYDWSLGHGLNAFVGANVNHQGSAFNGFGEHPQFAIDAFTLLDLRAGIEAADSRWRLAFWAHNATDKYYWINQLRIGDTITKVVGMPRTFGVAYTYWFF
ncbi:MAG: TonB-dependent receptor [Rudaea sp.]|uniref:TonB-dependent receptor n=1 Tax=Rudaea sp. TaxID=2136325 RepID=UPI0039E52784